MEDYSIQIDLKASSECEHIISMFQILQEYYYHLARKQHAEGATGRDERETEATRKPSGRKKKRKVDEDDEPFGAASLKKQALAPLTTGPEMERFLRADEFGPAPLIVAMEHSLLRSTLPGIQYSFEPEKIDLAKQYLYTDQIVTDLQLLGGVSSEGKSFLTTAPKKEFMKKLNQESLPRSELNRLAALLPTDAREALFSDKDDVSSQYFCREGMTVCRPYLTKRMRERYESIKLQYQKDLVAGDVLHVPFSESERRTLARFSEPLACLEDVCHYLPGRAAIDIQRFLEEREADEGSMQVEGKMATIDEMIVYQPVDLANGKKSSVSRRTLFSTTAREIQTQPSGTMEKSACKSLLASLAYLGKSSVPTDAIVDCKLDPTGKTSKAIIGTARNDSAQPAVNVSVLYDLRNRTIQSLTEHTDTVSASDFSIDGQYIITASYDLNIIVRESATGNVVRYLGRNDPENIVQHEARILNMVLHRTRNDILATFSEKQIMVWNSASGDMLTELTRASPVSGPLIDMCFANGAYCDMLVVGSEASNSKGELRLWDTNTSTVVHSVYEPRGTISCIATNSHSSIVSATKSVLRLIDFRTPDETVCLYKTGQDDVNIVSFSPCERYLQSSATDNRCLVFDTRVPSRPLLTLAHQAPLTQDISGQVGINSAVWTKDGNFLMTGGEDGVVRLWDVISGDPFVNALQATNPICACDLSQYYDMVIAGDETGTISVWSLSGGQYTISDEDLIIINGNPNEIAPNGAPAENDDDFFAMFDRMRDGLATQDDVPLAITGPQPTDIPFNRRFFSDVTTDSENDDESVD